MSRRVARPLHPNLVETGLQLGVSAWIPEPDGDEEVMKAAIWQDDESREWNLSLFVDGAIDTDSSLASGSEMAELWRTAAEMGFKLSEIEVMKSEKRADDKRGRSLGRKEESSSFLRLWRKMSGR